MGLKISRRLCHCMAFSMLHQPFDNSNRDHLQHSMHLHANLNQMIIKSYLTIKVTVKTSADDLLSIIPPRKEDLIFQGTYM